MQGTEEPLEAEILKIGNRLKGKTMNVSLKAPDSQRRSNFSLIGNVSDASFGSSSPPIVITGFDGVTIRDNVLPLDDLGLQRAICLNYFRGRSVSLRTMRRMRL